MAQLFFDGLSNCYMCLLNVRQCNIAHIVQRSSIGSGPCDEIWDRLSNWKI